MALVRSDWIVRLVVRAAGAFLLAGVFTITTAGAVPRNDFVSFEVSPAATSYTMVLDPAHHYIFVALMQANRIAVVSTTTHDVIASISIPVPTSVDISPDGTRIAVGTASQYIYTIDTTTLAIVDRVPVRAVGNPVYPNYLPLQVLYLSNGKALLRVYDGVTAYGGIVIMEWDLATNFIQTRADIGSGDIENMVRSADYRKVFMGGGGGGAVLALYDADSDTVQYGQGETLSYGGPIAASADGTQFAAYIWYPGGLSAVLYLDAAMNEVGRKNSSNVWGLAYSADGRYLYSSEAYAGPTVVFVVDTQTQEVVGEIPDAAVVSAQTRLQGVDEAGRLFGSSNHGISFLDSTFSTLSGSGAQFSFPLTVLPNSGPVSGGTQATLQGTFPTGAASVYFGDTAANAAQGNRVVTTPAGSAAGPVNVSWYSSAGLYAVAPEGFSYGPYVKEVMATAGSAKGGEEITLWGYGFGSGSDSIAVTVGGAAATVVSRQSTPPTNLGSEQNPFPLQTLVIRTPAGVAGFADLSITTPSGTTDLPRAFQYLQESEIYPRLGALANPTYDAVRNLLYIANGDRVEVFDVAGKTYKAGLLVPSANSASAKVFGLDITPDGSRLLATDMGANTLYIFDLNSGSLVKSISFNNLYPGYVPARVVATNNGKAVVQFSSTNSPCCFIKQVDLAGAGVQDFPALGGCGGSAIAGVKNGSKLFIAQTGCSAGTVYLYDFQSGNLMSNVSSGYLSDAVTAADGNVFSAGGTVPSIVDDSLFLKARPWRSAFYGDTSLLWGETINASGSLIFDPVSLNVTGGATQNYIDVLDVHRGNLAGRVITPELLGGPTNFGRLLTVDAAGHRMFALTQSGLSVMQFVSAPLSVGGVYPGYGVPAGGEAATIRGNGFQQGIAVEIGGVSVSATWVDESTVTVTVPALPVGFTAVTVTNPDGSSYTLRDAFLVMAKRPTPVIASISPQQGSTLGDGPAITVQGSGFFFDAVVRLNGSDRPTSYASSTQLTVQLSGDDLVTPGGKQITVFSPLGGGISNSVIFAVVNPAPSVTGLSPSRFVIGDPNPGIGVFGNGLVSNSVVRWNGTPLTTTYSSPSLTAVVPPALVAAAGTANIDVVNPSPGGGTSAPMQVVIAPKGPYLTYPAHIDMGQIPVGALSYVNVNMRSTGTDNLTVSSVNLSGGFSLGYNGQTVFEPYALLEVQISTTPTQAGAMSGALTITDNTASSPHVIPVAAQAVVMQPAAITDGANVVTDSTAVLTGDANPNGPDTNAFFEYGTDPSLQSNQKTQAQLIASNIYAQHFEATISGLQPDTTYYYRAVANNSNGAGSGAIVSFTTKSADFWFDVPINVTLVGKAGDTITYDSLPLDASGAFQGNVALACFGAPQKATCAVSPASAALTPGGQVILQVKVTTTMTIGSAAPLGMQVWAVLSLSLGFAVGLIVIVQPRSPRLRGTGLLILVTLLILAAGCSGGGTSTGGGGVGPGGGGGGGNPQPQAGTPTGAYVLSITATVNGRTKSQNLNLIVN